MIEIAIRKDVTPDGMKPEMNGFQDEKEQGRMGVQMGAVNTAIIQAGKQVLSSGIREYGNITGNYAVVESVDNALSIGADVLMIAKGGIIGIIAVGTKHAISISSSFIAQEKAYRDLDLLQRRAGKIYTSGGR